MSNACHDAESWTRLRRPIDDAACSALAGAYIKLVVAITAARKRTMRMTNELLNWAKRGVGLNRAGAFFVRKIQVTANNQLAAVKE